jgi:hypothetical protein
MSFFIVRLERMSNIDSFDEMWFFKDEENAKIKMLELVDVHNNLMSNLNSRYENIAYNDEKIIYLYGDKLELRKAYFEDRVHVYRANNLSIGA